MNQLVHLRLSILELSKILKYKFCYDYIKPKYGVKRKLCYVDIESFIVYIIKNIYKDIAEDVEITFYTSNYKLDRPLAKGKTKK